MTGRWGCSSAASGQRSSVNLCSVGNRTARPRTAAGVSSHHLSLKRAWASGGCRANAPLNLGRLGCRHGAVSEHALAAAMTAGSGNIASREIATVTDPGRRPSASRSHFRSFDRVASPPPSVSGTHDQVALFPQDRLIALSAGNSAIRCRSLASATNPRLDGAVSSISRS